MVGAGAGVFRGGSFDRGSCGASSVSASADRSDAVMGGGGVGVFDHVCEG